MKSALVQEVLSNMSSSAQESFSGIAVIKSYNLQGIISKGFDDYKWTVRHTDQWAIIVDC